MGIFAYLKESKPLKKWEKDKKNHSSLTSSLEVFLPPSQRLLLLQSRESSFCFRYSTLTQMSQLTRDTVELETASQECTKSKDSPPSGEVTWLTSSVSSQPRL